MMTRIRAAPTHAMGQTQAIMVGVTPAVLGLMPKFLIGTLAVRLSLDIGMTPARVGAAAAAFGLAFAASAAPLGRIVQRYGAVAGLRFGVAGSAAAMMGVATTAHSAATFILFLALAGVASAGIQSSVALWLARTVRSERQGLAFGISQAAAPGAALLAGLAVPLIAATVGWRWVFVGGGIFAITMSALVPTSGAGASPSVTVATAGRVHGGMPVPAVVLLAMGMGLGIASTSGYITFMVTAGVNVGMSETAAGLAFSVGSAIGIAARIGFGHTIDRVATSPILLACALVVAGALGQLLLLTGTVTAYVVATPWIFALGWGWPGLVHLAIVRISPHAQAAASGVMYAGGGLGAFLGPFVVGIVIERSVNLAWIAAASLAVAGASVMILGRAMFMRSVKQRASHPVGR